MCTAATNCLKTLESCSSTRFKWISQRCRFSPFCEFSFPINNFKWNLFAQTVKWKWNQFAQIFFQFAQSLDLVLVVVSRLVRRRRALPCRPTANHPAAPSSRSSCIRLAILSARKKSSPRRRVFSLIRSKLPSTWRTTGIRWTATSRFTFTTRKPSFTLGSANCSYPHPQWIRPHPPATRMSLPRKTQAIRPAANLKAIPPRPCPTTTTITSPTDPPIHRFQLHSNFSNYFVAITCELNTALNVFSL